jgi:apolipoprotein N-acyltransferase
VLVLTAVLVYGGWRLSQNDFPIGPKVALIQSNLPQAVRNAAAIDYFNNLMLTHNCRLTDRAMQMKPDLIVWPETSHPNYWSVLGPGVERDAISVDNQLIVAGARDDMRKLGKRWPTNVLFGVNSEVFAGGNRSKLYNSALLITEGGIPIARYDKIHRVPFGEYVPLRDWLPLMNWFAPYDYDYSTSAGEHFTRFPVRSHDGEYRFGVVICYEDSDPSLARQYVAPTDREPPVDFLLNISNDGWFKGTSEHEEHLAICRFRAVECRRAVLRSVNMGVSAVIDGNGQVLAPGVFSHQDSPEPMTFWGIPDRTASLPPSQWANFKSTAGVLAAVVPIDSRESLYAMWGDWLPWTCWLMLGASLVVARFRPVSM